MYEVLNLILKGPHSRVNVMLVRGIFANFKIPIWYRYDSVLEKTEFLGIIDKIENCTLLGANRRGFPNDPRCQQKD